MNVTRTLVLFHPAAFRGGAVLVVITGGVVSTTGLTISRVNDVPARLMNAMMISFDPLRSVTGFSISVLVRSFRSARQSRRNRFHTGSHASAVLQGGPGGSLKSDGH